MQKTPPTVAFYTPTFLKPEMLHVYRQITSVSDFHPVVITPKHENAELFPFPPGDLHITPRSRTRAIERIWHKKITNSPWLLSRAETRHLAELIDRKNISLLHIFFGHIGIRLLPFIRQKKIPIVVSFHGADLGVTSDQKKHAHALRQLFDNADAILGRSDHLRERLIAAGSKPSKTHTLHTGIPMEDWTSQNRIIPPNNSAWHIIQASRFVEKKGLLDTLRAFASIHKKKPTTKLTLAGDGPLRPAVVALANRLGIDNALHMPGMVDEQELRELMNSAHIFVHPSVTAADGNIEGIPNSIIEAMATGLPVVATDHAGIPEAVINGKNGYLVAENDPLSLAQALEKIINNPDHYPRLSCAAAEMAHRNFSSSVQQKKLSEIYTNLIC